VLCRGEEQARCAAQCGEGPTSRPFEADFVEKNADGRDKPGLDELWENRLPAQTPRSFIAREYALMIRRTIVARMSGSDMRVAVDK
jgi:hypothetical protein